MQSMRNIIIYLLALIGLLPLAWAGNTPIAPDTTLQPLETRLGEAISYSEEGPNYVGFLSIGKERPIDETTYLYVKFALEHYREKGVAFVLLKLNTPGGEVFSTLKICELLQKLDTNDHIPVVAFIDNWAISAGAMLAYSCRFIAAAKSASMGAAEPITMGGDGKMETASEKVNSALRAEISNLANYYGRNPLIAEAMVDKDMILVLRDGKVVRLENEGELSKGDQIISRKGKLLTLNAEQLMTYKVADFMVPAAPVATITVQEEKAGSWPAAKNPLFHEPFFAKIPQAFIISYTDWKIGFFAFLTHPFIASILVIGLIIGIYLELSYPGLILPAAVAIICLAFLILSHFAAEAVQWLELIILGSGVLLLILEFFVLPTVGFLAFLGMLLTFVGLFLLFLPNFGQMHFSFDTSQWNIAAHELIKRLGWFSAAILAALLFIVLIARFLPHRFPLIRRLILKGEQDASDGYVSGLPQHLLPSIGKEGAALTPLRPGGKIVIEEKIFDVFSDGEWIERGEWIKVIRVEGGKIIVKRHSSPSHN